ncbi:hypothetical protein [Pseudolysinimonas sp.]|uniref:hypothetical protein n=1 Tax=Pseudolysinimonas sp. TaxID=2680009 RepID=UPI003F80CD15
MSLAEGLAINLGAAALLLGWTTFLLARDRRREREGRLEWKARYFELLEKQPASADAAQKEQPAEPAIPAPPAATHASDSASQVELSYPHIYLGDELPGVHVRTRSFPIGFTIRQDPR